MSKRQIFAAQALLDASLFALLGFIGATLGNELYYFGLAISEWVFPLPNGWLHTAIPVGFFVGRLFAIYASDKR